MKRKIALVTGVSRLDGIGRAICVELAKKDIDIFFTYWTAYDKEMPWKVVDEEPFLIQKEIQDLNIRCLLYTSPSPRDLSTSRMPSSA